MRGDLDVNRIAIQIMVLEQKNELSFVGATSGSPFFCYLFTYNGELRATRGNPYCVL